MRELSAATILALHALQHLMLKRKPVSVREIGRSSGSEADRIRPILARLQQAGMIRSRPGKGFLLARAPGEISLQDIVRAMHEAQPPTAPCGGDFDACDSRASCILAPICRNAELGFQETLRSFTLADLASSPLDLPNCGVPGARSRA